MKKLSVIIPAYNEENRISQTLFDVENTLSKQPFDYEIVVVNDGSIDGTSSLVMNLKNKISRLIFIDNKDNHGKGYATKQGMLSATGDIRLFMDADNSTKVGEIFKMLPLFDQGFDVVVGSRYLDGSRILVKQSKLRIFLGKILRIIVHTFINIGVEDSQCGFKAFTEKAVEVIFPKQTIFRWAFDVDILVLAKKNNLKIKEIPVTWINEAGSHIRFFSAVQILLEIIKVRIRM